MPALTNVLPSPSTCLLTLSVAAFAVLGACRTNGASQVKDDQWINAQDTPSNSAAISPASDGLYNVFFSGDTPAVNFCSSDDLTCHNNPTEAVPMLVTKTANGLPAFAAATPLALTEGENITFYTAGATTGIQFQITRSANGQLDPTAVPSSVTGAAPDTSKSRLPTDGTGTTAPPVTGTTTPPVTATTAADPLVPNPDGIALTGDEASLIRETNRARQMTDPTLPILAARQNLMDIARATASYNAQYNTPDRHSGANTYENVYYAMPDAQSVVFGSAMGPGWLYHEGHRENVLNNTISGIGAGMTRSADGTTQWVEDML